MDLRKLPYMLYADSDGRIYDHPYYRMAGFSGNNPVEIGREDLFLMPEFSKLFFIPDCPPIGLDPETGQYTIVRDIEVDGEIIPCFAVAAFLEPGFVRSHLPAVDYSSKSYNLPMWGYSAVGFKGDEYYAAGFRIEYNHRWDPRNYDDRDLVPAINKFKREFQSGSLVDHLTNCAVNNHCFAAKNLFLGRWEAPLPISQVCNADCIGCISLQVDQACSASHHRISFRPEKDEIVSLSISHLEKAPDGIMSFGQGCEGEPLTEYKLIAGSIRDIRAVTEKGTINLNTNGSWPERVREVAESGLDSIRISLNSAQPDLYRAYYRPKNYVFEDVVESIRLSREMGLYTMLNYLVFPGVNDCLDEIDALKELINKTNVNFIHMKNLNIDPQQYMEAMPATQSPAIGMKKMAEKLEQEFPDLELGYFNQPVNGA